VQAKNKGSQNMQCIIESASQKQMILNTCIEDESIDSSKCRTSSVTYVITFEQRLGGIDKCETNWLQRSRTRHWGSSIHSDNTGKQQIASSCFMKMTAICMGVDKTFVPFKDSPRPVLNPQEIFKGRSSVTSLQLTSWTQPDTKCTL
jgi:hypothetical protein